MFKDLLLEMHIQYDIQSNEKIKFYALSHLKRIGYDKRVIISYDFSDIYSFKYLNYLIKIRFYFTKYKYWSLCN